MQENIREAAEAHAAKEYPRESCGLVVLIAGVEHYVPCKNTAVSSEHFQIAPEQYAAAEDAGTITAIIHSHPDYSAEPSQADRVACEDSGLPWHIVGYPSLKWCSIAPEGYRAPLIGREFSHGILDCYTLIQDWYLENKGVELIDIPRRDEWWKKGENLYSENFVRAGFTVTDDLHEGAVILMQVLSDVPNHAAIYVEDNIILHHLHGRLSCRDVYGGYWRKHTTHILKFTG